MYDNAANVVAALRVLEKRHGISSVHCTGHTLQLVVNHALKNPQTVGTARFFVEHLERSETGSSNLKTKGKPMGLPEHNLQQDVNMRWNSSYYMISLLLEQVAEKTSSEQALKSVCYYSSTLWVICGSLFCTSTSN